MSALPAPAAAHRPFPACPGDRSTLGALAEKCHAYAKALHYKELEFQASKGRVGVLGCMPMLRTHAGLSC